MNALNNAGAEPAANSFSYSAPVVGETLNINDGFEAQSFKHSKFSGLMDPLVMVDHFVMSQPTFGEHPHAGMSAVSVLFEDSVGLFNSQDSLGNNIDLQPGDLYWLKAGKGVTHDEKPIDGGVTHGLQIFVNLPSRSRKDSPQALHVSSKNMPVIAESGSRVRVVLGESNGVVGRQSPSLPLTILDAFLNPGSNYKHTVRGNQSIWAYIVAGTASVSLEGKHFELAKGEAMAMHVSTEQAELTLKSFPGAHIVVLQGEPFRELFVQQGPFVMNNSSDLKAIVSAYEQGRLGSIQATKLI